MKKEIKEFREEVEKELGYISGVFMSQGDTKAKNIIMPTTELEEAVDRIGLYLFKAQEAQKADIRKKIEGMRVGERPPNFKGDNDPQWWDDNHIGYNQALDQVIKRI